MKRRDFIHHASCAAMGTATLYSSLLDMKAMGMAAISNSSVIKSNDYKALVCILLGGGNDSFNMLIPRQGTPYQEYAKSRSNNAIPSDSLLPIDVLGGDGKSYGLHPSLTSLHSMFQEGNLAFFTNIGTLVEPTTVNQFFLETVDYPLGLLSHSDQIQQWQTALPQDRSSVGWVGKMTELIGDMNNNQTLSLSVSLSGTNFIQTGQHTVPYTMIPGEGAAGIHDFDTEWEAARLRNRAIKDMVEQQYADAFEKTYINTIKKSLDSYDQYIDAFARTQGNIKDVVFPTDQWQFGQSMKTIADTIVARDVLDQQRQTFFVEFGGWDHHDELLLSHASQLEAVDQAINSFYSALDLIGISENVTTFVISDFGRPLTSNGNGTDHAWGGNVFAVGGAVDGQKIFGRYPDLSLKDKSDMGGGVFIPELSADEYFAELALWFGVSPSDLPTILPNIGNFYDIQSGSMPIGFLNT